jgi:hypothetical protein
MPSMDDVRTIATGLDPPKESRSVSTGCCTRVGRRGRSIGPTRTLVTSSGK